MEYRYLRRTREKLGYTQEQMAMLLGLSSRNAYALKEKGKRGVDVREALALAKFLDEPVEWLFSQEEVNNMVTIGGIIVLNEFWMARLILRERRCLSQNRLAIRLLRRNEENSRRRAAYGALSHALALAVQASDMLLETFEDCPVKGEGRR